MDNTSNYDAILADWDSLPTKKPPDTTTHRAPIDKPPLELEQDGRCWIDNPPQGKPERKPFSIISYDTVELREKEFSWYPFWRHKEANCLCGVQGTGKSTFTKYFAAMLSLGRRMSLPFQDLQHNYVPFDEEPKRTLFFDSEDDPNDTAAPQLKAMGADMRHIHFVPVDEFGFNIYDPRIEEAIKQVRPYLLVLDPVQQFISGKDPHGVPMDINNSPSVRQAITHLKNLARQYDMTVIIVSHPNKNPLVPALHSVSGSHEFTSTPRGAVYLGTNPADKEEVIVTLPKSNGVRQAHKKSLGYKFDYKNGVIVWTGESQLEADDVTPSKQRTKKQISESEPDEKPLSEVDKAVNHIEALLKDRGYIEIKEANKKMAAMGFTTSTIGRAKKKLEKEAGLKSTGSGVKDAYWFYAGFEPPQQQTL